VKWPFGGRHGEHAGYLSRVLGRLSLQTRWMFVIAVATAVVGGLLLSGLVAYTARSLARFNRTEAQAAAVIYSAPQMLRAGVHVDDIDLAGTLRRLGYREVSGQPAGPGEFRRTAAAWDLYLRADHAEDTAGRVRLETHGGRIVRASEGRTELELVVLPPEPLGSASPSGEESLPVRLSDVPTAVRAAVLAAEDARFFEHSGLDIRALARAFWTNFRAGRIVEGGSTLTQQLVKNRLLTPQRTFSRKLEEAWLSTVLDWRYPKERIFEAYLNEVYLGHVNGTALHGVGAAARAYFGKEVSQLSLADAALLAGIIRAPNSYSPAVHAEAARRRRDAVLGRMRELGQITQAEYDRARQEPVRPKSLPLGPRFAAYFSDYVRAQADRSALVEKAGPGGRIFTTLDVPLQRFAESAVARGLAQLEARWPALRQPTDGLQAVLVALDPSTGAIRALVGGRDYRASQFNRAVNARRQPGSAFKPFVYLAALAPDARSGLTAASIIEDVPVTIPVSRGEWTPRNYRDHYEGRVTVRRALEQSLNAATIRVAESVGLPAIIETAKAVGLDDANLQPVPSLALGAIEVTPLGLARAYLPLANGGTLHAVKAIDEIADVRHRTVWQSRAEDRRVLSDAEAYVMTSLLQGVVNSGTGAGLQRFGIGNGVAGKTGTTNDGRDAWFVGYSSNLLTLVWVGFDDGRAHGLSGAEAALPIWADFMRRALGAYPATPFVIPTGVTMVDIDATNGKRANEFCPLVVREVFIAGTEPERCEEHGQLGDRLVQWWDRVRGWFRRW
jgi:penicillin-binding protein 1B